MSGKQLPTIVCQYLLIYEELPYEICIKSLVLINNAHEASSVKLSIVLS